MSSTTALSNRSTSSSHHGPSSSFQLAPAWLKTSGESAPSPAPAPRQGNGSAANGHRSGPTNPPHVHLAGGKLRNPISVSAGTPHAEHYSQRPPVAGDFPTLDSANRARPAGQPASMKNWKEAALAVDLAAASKEPVPAQEREREREKEREKERLVNLVPKAPTPKKAHGKGGAQAKNPRDRDNRNKPLHDPVPPPKPHTRSESPVLPTSGTSGGMVVLSMPKASRIDSGPVRRSESAPLREASPVLLPAATSGGSAPSTPHSPVPPSSTSAGSQSVRPASAGPRSTSSLMQHFTSPPLDEAEEVEVPLSMAEEELRFMKELGWQAEDADEVAPLTNEEILQFKEFATMAPRANKTLDEQRMLADRSLSEWARRRAAP